MFKYAFKLGKLVVDILNKVTKIKKLMIPREWIEARLQLELKSFHFKGAWRIEQLVS